MRPSELGFSERFLTGREDFRLQGMTSKQQNAAGAGYASGGRGGSGNTPRLVVTKIKNPVI